MDLFRLPYRTIRLVQRLLLLRFYHRSLYRLVGYIERQGTLNWVFQSIKGIKKGKKLNNQALAH
jgi:hypothetical protein